MTNLEINVSQKGCRRTHAASFAAGLSLLALLGIGAVSASAQTPAPGTAPATPVAPPTPAVATAPLITANTYKIAPEDTLEISVQDHPELLRSVVVLEDGTIDMPYCGQVQVLGLTITETKKKLTKLLDRTFVRPQVSIAVRGRQLRQASIIGPVRNPGKIPLREGYRVLDLVAASGGLPSDRYEYYRITLYRDRDKQLVPIDVEKLMRDKDPQQNIPVDSEDILTITEIDPAAKTVQVIGEVGHPGPIELPRSASLLDVLQASGGPTANAALSQAFIKRGSETIPLDLRNYRQTGFDVKEKLQPGDQVVIPENKTRIKLFGAIGQPGERPYPDDRKLTVYSAIALAGGQTIGAELKKTRLIRQKPDGTTSTQVVDVEQMLKTGDLSKDVAVEPGDSIYVPGNPGRRGLGTFEILGLLGAIPTVYALFTGRIFR